MNYISQLFYTWNRANSPTDQFYSQPYFKLEFSYLPIILANRSKIWFKEYVKIIIPWSGVKGNGEAIFYITMEEHRDMNIAISCPITPVWMYY